MILDFHVPWITSFNLFCLWYFNFMYLGLQVSTCMFFLLHSEDVNLFVYTLNRKFQLVSWLFTKSKSANYFQELLFFYSISNSAKYQDFKVSFFGSNSCKMLLEVVRVIYYEITHKNKTLETIINISNNSVNPLNGFLRSYKDRFWLIS